MVILRVHAWEAGLLGMGYLWAVMGSPKLLSCVGRARKVAEILVTCLTPKGGVVFNTGKLLALHN